MTRLADMRDRLEALTAPPWCTRIRRGIGLDIFSQYGNVKKGRMLWDQDADFVAHAPGDMRALLDAWDFVLDGKSIRYVTAQLDEISEELETAGDHAMAQMLSRLAVMLGRLG